MSISFLIVSSWRSPDLWLELIDRYLIAAGLSEIVPIVCINKADLIDDHAEYESATDHLPSDGPRGDCHVRDNRTRSG